MLATFRKLIINEIHLVQVFEIQLPESHTHMTLHIELENRPMITMFEIHPFYYGRSLIQMYIAVRRQCVS